MVTLSAQAALEKNGKGARSGVLGSPALRQIGLFDRALAANGMHGLYPQDEPALLAAIQSVKRSGPSPAAGADLCLVDCTEFSLLRGEPGSPVPVIDTLDVLTRAIRDFVFCGFVPAEVQV